MMYLRSEPGTMVSDTHTDNSTNAGEKGVGGCCNFPNSPFFSACSQVVPQEDIFRVFILPQRDFSTIYERNV